MKAFSGGKWMQYVVRQSVDCLCVSARKNILAYMPEWRLMHASTCRGYELTSELKWRHSVTVHSLAGYFHGCRLDFCSDEKVNTLRLYAIGLQNLLAAAKSFGRCVVLLCSEPCCCSLS